MPQDDARASSPGSWAANPFISDPGPAFDPDEPGEPPAAATPLQLLDVQWEPGRIKTILRAQGLLTHDLIGVGEEDWEWRASELEAVSEPLANVLNKFPVTHAAAAVSDELTVGAVMFEYAGRSIRERVRIIRAAKREQAAGPQPITGVTADGTRVEPPIAEPAWKVPE